MKIDNDILAAMARGENRCRAATIAAATGYRTADVDRAIRARLIPHGYIHQCGRVGGVALYAITPDAAPPPAIAQRQGTPRAGLFVVLIVWAAVFAAAFALQH